MSVAFRSNAWCCPSKRGALPRRRAVSDPERCRVLIVEHEYFLTDNLNRAFISRWAEVICPIGYFSEALSHIIHGGFDVAVLQLKLHDKATLALADRLKDDLSIPFVFATGYSNELFRAAFRTCSGLRGHSIQKRSRGTCARSTTCRE